MVGVHEPLFQDADSHLPGTGHLTHDLPGQGKIVPVDGAQEFGPQDRHVFWIPRAEKEVALISAGAAADTTIHENFQGTKLFQPLLQAGKDDLLPVFRKLPVIILRRPFSSVGKVQPLLAVEILDFILLGDIGIIALFKDHRNIHPVPGWYCSSCQGRSLHYAFR